MEDLFRSLSSKTPRNRNPSRPTIPIGAVISMRNDRIGLKSYTIFYDNDNEGIPQQGEKATGIRLPVGVS